ncbi:Wzz/FepE/Etk N-terminal domain-containing protein [Neobacillus sp. MER 74]|uniref:YveK family protein n=1 Tax=Neobacillus sp. MER 74 TaxID=2939566 RepID=UPI00203AEC5F|nr:Wzz/FepE/Etk N-terminal domain-containing protein [Neobacillus sp. MER 74]MCM3115103.1 Wzz/FepE/Etk N-terminal domain-containing protein [Neobacillus sp. MER 74]
MLNFLQKNKKGDFVNQLNETPKRAKEINLKELFLVIKRRLWIIVFVAIIAGFVGGILNNSSATPLFASSSRVIIGADEESRKTLQVIVKDSVILDKVIQQLGLKVSAEALATQLTVESLESSQVVSISVVDQDPSQAAKIADTTAQIFKDEVPNIVGQDYVRLLSKAKVKPTPINPKNNNKLYIAIIGGIVVGIGLAFLLESLDDRIRPEDDIEKLLDLPFLGRVPKASKRNVKKRSMKFQLESRGENVGIK